MPRRKPSSARTVSKDPSASKASSADLTAPTPIRSELRKQRRRHVLVILAVLGVMLMSMAVGVYMYVSDPDGWKTVFPAGAKVTIERPIDDAAILIPAHLRFAEPGHPGP